MERHVVVTDLAYGDSGKGAAVDRLCAEGDVEAVVRYSGGCQAAHNVVLDDGTHHTFAQFGAGTLRGVPTILSRHMLVEPFSLFIEAAHLHLECCVPDPLSMVTIDPRAVVTTPYHRAVGRARERERGVGRHGSTGRGIGETVRQAIQSPGATLTVSDLSRAEGILREQREWMLGQDLYLLSPEDAPEPDVLARLYREMSEELRVGYPLGEALDRGRVVFEGAQGVLLDETWGFAPYHTWTTTTPRNALSLLAEHGVPREDLTVLGLTRAYTTRHGPGPFVAEDERVVVPEPHNTESCWQGSWRAGHLDVPALRYAIRASGGVDGVCVSHLDVESAGDPIGVCVAYEWAGRSDVVEDPGALPADSRTESLMSASPLLRPFQDDDRAAEVARLLDLPLLGSSFGPRAGDGGFHEERSLTASGARG